MCSHRPLHPTRPAGRDRAPVRIVHLGLGNFFRAHTCWYTEHCADAADWGIAAFSGRTATHVDALRTQDEVYTLLIQGPEPTVETISALSAVHTAAESDAWRGYFASPEVSLVTSSITEGGYVRDAAGNLDLTRVAADVAVLRADPAGPVTSAPGKFVAGLLARRAAGAGPITFLPCDNVVSSGAMVRTVVTQMAAAVDPGLVSWIEANVGFNSAMVDRITPQPTPADFRRVAELTGYDDPAAVVTEPFTEWVIEGTCRTPRPAWETADAQFVADIVPFEHRKLWLLNGSHSLLAYAGPLRGHATVQQAIADPIVAGWVEAWWDEAAAYLPLPETEIRAYRASLLARFQNPALQDVLSRIAADGSQKLPIRVVPTLRADLDHGRTPTAALRAIAAWVWHVRGRSTPVNDARQAEVVALGDGTLDDTVTNVLAFLDLPGDLHGAVAELARDFGG
ncbi:MAG: mannitol dehydrogenase family protein [Propionibacteriaceae bacterium]|jgi:fructuronate reductase|nr:mannitol dehydrogenase family protein [Propionibacteriaceae bacterium]